MFFLFEKNLILKLVRIFQRQTVRCVQWDIDATPVITANRGTRQRAWEPASMEPTIILHLQYCHNARVRWIIC